MPLEAGSQFGRFRIVRQLGAGAMGEVYLAEDPHIERLLAIKTVRVLERGGEVEKGLRERLAREAKAAGRLVHPHVVTLFEAGEIDGAFYLAFEYIEGSDLAVRMRRPPPIGVDEALRIVREAASGLAAAHRRGIVHRDVKPSNLLLDADGVVKVTDFGIAKLVGQGTAYTASGSIVGTPQYLSPEQVRSEELDGRSDLFSLGAVLYELLAQRRPFDGDTITSLMYQILHQQPPPIATIHLQLSPRLAATVERLLAKDREQRFPSGEALVEELAAIERERAEMRDRPTITVPERRAPPQPAPAAAAPNGGAGEGAELGSAVPSGEERQPPVVEDAAGSRGRAAGTRRWLVGGIAAAVLLVLAAVVVAALVVHWIDDGRDDPPHDDPATVAGREAGGLEAAAESSPLVPVDERRKEQLSPVEPNGERAAAGTPSHEPEGAAFTAVEERADSGAVATQRRIVGSALTFLVSPPEAARVAQVKIDGLVRGSPSASLMTLRPGAHRVELVATGFEPLVVEVDSRPGAPSPTRLELSMRRAPTP